MQEEEDEFANSPQKREDHDSSSGDGEDLYPFKDNSQEGIVNHRASQFKVSID
jgi:hypothetical protein